MGDKDLHGRSENMDVGMSISVSYKSARRSEETVRELIWD